MPEPAALLFDLDGTLVDSEGFHSQALRNWFASRGWPASEELVAGFAGRRADEVMATEPGPWAGGDPEVLIHELLAQSALLPPPQLADDAAELLTSTEIPLALVTSANLDWARTCLGDLLDRFVVVVTRDEVSQGKPDPEPFSLACQLLGVAPADCVAVEDAPAGIASAVAAGIGLVIAVTGTVDRSELGQAHQVVAGLAEASKLWTGGPTSASAFSN